MSKSSSVSLCMIVRDAQRTLAAALDSIRPWVDEMVVVDTGSTDSSREIAAAYGARLFEFAWCDSFAAARNESLKYAQSDWIFWMDSDDTIDEANGAQLRRLAERPMTDDVLGYIMQVRCPGPDDGQYSGTTVVDHVKMFRNREDLVFEGRIHEQILPSIRRAGGDVERTDVFVTHSGYDHSPAGHRRKLERDLRLLQLELADRPRHPFVLFNLGMTLSALGEKEQAVAMLSECVVVSTPEESHTRKAYALLVEANRSLQHFREAWAACRTGRVLFADDIELRFREGQLLMQRGCLREAAAAFEAILALPRRDYFASFDEGMSAYLSKHQLAEVHLQLGDVAKAEALWTEVSREVPNFTEATLGLAAVWIRQGRKDEARNVLASVPQASGDYGLARHLLADIAISQQDLAAAQTELGLALEACPDRVDWLDELCEVACELGHFEEAEALLRRLVEQCPESASAWQNLGAVQIQRGDYEQAISSLRHSLELRPNFGPTEVSLGLALAKTGQVAAAVHSWRAVIDRDPDSHAADRSRRLLAEHELT